MNRNEDIEQLISRIPRLTEREISDLAVAWGSVERTKWKAFRNAELATWEAVWGADLATWESAWYALDAALDAALDTMWGDRRGVQNAAWNAVLALEAKELISEEHFNALYGPWRSVMER